MGSDSLVSRREAGGTDLSALSPPQSRSGSASLADLLDDAAELLAQRARVVGDAVALADLPDLDGDLGVAMGRQVGEQVVLDLVAQVAAT